MSVSLRKVFFVLAVTVFAAGCNQVRGRRIVQEGNRLYRDGHYKEAIATFENAERLVPDLPQLWLNKGFTCRQMIVPGARTPESISASKCAMSSFKRYQELAPQDSRGDMLYIQTLFDSDEYETLVKIYEQRLQQNSRDIESINGLIQVYSKWNKLEEALEWYNRKAEVLANDPEAQYAVGVFIWQQLMQKGGGPDKAAFDPRPDPKRPRQLKTPPPGAYGDIVSQQRIDVADTGIKFLERAVELRPKYHEAMTYVNLLYRQKSFAYFDQPDEWQKCVDKAEEWRRKSLETQGKTVTTPAPTLAAADADDDDDDDKPVAARAPAKSGKKAGKKPARKGKRARR
jgi:pentatricopeptide repeat protein